MVGDSAPLQPHGMINLVGDLDALPPSQGINGNDNGTCSALQARRGHGASIKPVSVTSANDHIIMHSPFLLTQSTPAA